MLDIKFIRENIALVKENVANRHAHADIDRLLVLDEERRGMLSQLDAMRAKRNISSKGKPLPEEITAMRQLGEEIQAMEASLEAVQTEYAEHLLRVPNMTHPEAPVGVEDDFVVLHTNREPASFPFQPKDHEALLTERDLIDFERGTKVTGAKFYYSKGDMVRLNQTLIQYGIDAVTRHGYTLMETPDMAKHEILRGAGFNPRGEEKQIYNIEGNDISLIGTAEITVLGYHANEVLDLSAARAIRSFRTALCTEAGAYGRTSRGLYRVHQFTKLRCLSSASRKRVSDYTRAPGN